MISCFVELCLHESYQVMPLEAISVGSCLHTLAVKTMFDWLKDLMDFRHKAFTMSAGFNKIAYDFHLFDTLYTF